MATPSGTGDRSAGIILVAAFAAGVACTFVLTRDAMLHGPASPFFGLEEPTVEAERTPVADELPAIAAVLATRTSLEPAARPERLALGDAAAPIVAAIVSQAVPTAGRVEPLPDTTPPRPEAGESPLLPLPAVPEAAADEPEDVVVPPPDSALRALITRLTPDRQGEPPGAPPAEPAERPAAPAAAPLPGEAWNDPDGVNWTEPGGQPPRDPAPARSVRLLDRLTERRSDPRGDPPGQPPPVGGRLLDRIRDRRIPREPAGPPDAVAVPSASATPDGTHWPVPARLIEQLERLVHDARGTAAAGWATDTLGSLQSVTATGGPRDPAGEEPLIALGDRVAEGMSVADATPDAPRASQIRRAALAVSRRVAIWRAAESCCAEIAAGPRSPGEAELGPGLAAASTTVEIGRLLDALERFESSRGAADAAVVREALRGIAAAALESVRGIDRAAHDHYLSPNVRVAIHEQFVEKMLPESTVTTGPLQDFVLGRKVRGTKTIEQSTAVRFTPHPAEIRFELLVSGEVTSRTVTQAGSVAIHSRGLSTFTVFKPVQVSAEGLAFAAARGSASNQSRLAGIETDFDSVPLVGTVVRGIARNQHDSNLEEASREVNAKIVSRACREVDQQTEPQLSTAAGRIRDRFWKPMVDLGLEPTAVALETSAGTATARLRLAADDQLAAHTPRPRAPADALFSMQVHESSVNNACGRLGLAGRRFGLEELTRFICGRLGLPPRVPDDLPEGVEVTFAAVDPVRIECRDGLVHVRVALDALESGRRNNWYDIVAQVTYRPVTAGMQVMLEREGPVQLSGPGQKGRMEFGLRTIFSKMFPKERPVPLVPEKALANRRLAGVQAVQAVSADGWLAIALGGVTQAGGAKTSPTAARPAADGRRLLR